MTEPGEWVLATFVCVSLATYLTLQLYKAFCLLRSVMSGKCRAEATVADSHEVAGRFLWRVVRRCLFNEERSEMIAKVLELAEQRRLSKVRFTFAVGTPILIIPLTMLLFYHFTGQGGEQPMYLGHVTVLILLACTGALVSLSARQPGPTVRTCVYVAIMSELAATRFLYTCPFRLVFDRENLFVLRIVCGFMFGRPCLTAVLNCLVAAANVYQYACLSEGMGSQVDELFGAQSFKWFCVQEFYVIVEASVITYACDMRLVDEARATIMARASHSVEKAVTLLLRTICDVVVELDANLMLVDSADKLAGLLLRGTARSLQGTALSNLLPDAEDKLLFERSLKALPADVEAVAVPFHVRMQDSIGNALQVEVFHARLEHHIDGHSHHLVGLREFPDLPTRALPALAGDAQALAPADPEAVGGLGGRRVPSATSQCGPSSRGTPSQHQWEPLGEPLDSHSECSGSERSAPLCALPSFKMTRMEVQMLAMMTVLERWNIHMPRASCCPYHEYIHHGAGLLRKLKGRRCIRSFKPLDGAQCPNCGMLGDTPEDLELDEVHKKCVYCALGGMPVSEDEVGETVGAGVSVVPHGQPGRRMSM